MGTALNREAFQCFGGGLIVPFTAADYPFFSEAEGYSIYQPHFTWGGEEMSYTPNEWQTGDVVTAAKLNNMENGIASAGGMLLITVTDNGGSGYVADKTFAEIEANWLIKPVVVKYYDKGLGFTALYSLDGYVSEEDAHEGELASFQFVNYLAHTMFFIDSANNVTVSGY